MGIEFYIDGIHGRQMAKFMPDVEKARQERDDAITHGDIETAVVSVYRINEYRDLIHEDGHFMLSAHLSSALHWQIMQLLPAGNVLTPENVAKLRAIVNTWQPNRKNVNGKRLITSLREEGKRFVKFLDDAVAAGETITCVL